MARRSLGCLPGPLESIERFLQEFTTQKTLEGGQVFKYQEIVVGVPSPVGAELPGWPHLAACSCPSSKRCSPEARRRWS